MINEDWRLIYPHMDPRFEGLYQGGDQMVESFLSEERMLPYTIDQIIQAGILCLSHEIQSLLTPLEIKKKIVNALDHKQGLSLIRLGDGELLALAHDLLIPSKEIKRIPYFTFMEDAGFSLPDHESRDRLTQTLHEADIIGIPTKRWPTYQNLFNSLVSYHHWDLEEWNLTTSVINYKLFDETDLYQYLLSNYKVVLIGNKMKDGEQIFKKHKRNIAGHIPVKDINDVPVVLEKVGQYDFDVALVSAGIAANVICVELAKKKKVAIDFGHLIDELILGRKKW